MVVKDLSWIDGEKKVRLGGKREDGRIVRRRRRGAKEEAARQQDRYDDGSESERVFCYSRKSLWQHDTEKPSGLTLDVKLAKISRYLSLL